MKKLKVDKRFWNPKYQKDTSEKTTHNTLSCIVQKTRTPKVSQVNRKYEKLVFFFTDEEELEMMMMMLQWQCKQGISGQLNAYTCA